MRIPEYPFNLTKLGISLIEIADQWHLDPSLQRIHPHATPPPTPRHVWPGPQISRSPWPLIENHTPESFSLGIISIIFWVNGVFVWCWGSYSCKTSSRLLVCDPFVIPGQNKDEQSTYWFLECQYQTWFIYVYLGSSWAWQVMRFKESRHSTMALLVRSKIPTSARRPMKRRFIELAGEAQKPTRKYKR